jgi:hypothetical protein
MGTSSHPIYLGIYQLIDGKIQRIWFEQILFVADWTGLQYETTIQFEAGGKIRMRIRDYHWEFVPDTERDFCYLASVLEKEILYRWDGSRFILAEQKTILQEEIKEEVSH